MGLGLRFFIVAVFRVCFRRGSQVTRKPAGGWGLGVLLEGYGAGFSGFRGVFVEGFWKVLGRFSEGRGALADACFLAFCNVKGSKTNAKKRQPKTQRKMQKQGQQKHN